MPSADSLGCQVSRVSDRYSLLFTLPSQRSIFTYLFALCIIGGSANLISRSLSLSSLILGSFLGISIFFTTLLADFLNSEVFMREDPILDQRRCSFLSVLSCLFLYIFTFAANLVGVSNRDLWIKIISVGFFATLVFRLFVVSTISSVNYGKILSCALLQPTLFLIMLVVHAITEITLNIYSILSFLVSTIIAVLGIHLFVSLVNAAGKEIIGIRPLPLFRAFLANWTENLNEPLEHFLEQLGEERDVKVSLLSFKREKGLKGVIIVPVIHPGPFRNVGSSPLPHMIQTTLENKTKCLVSVPHGISGHDLDVASQYQNEKILSKIIEIADFKAFEFRATPFVRSEVNCAKASCQVFGDCAVLTLTLAPETMEDLPRELDYAIIDEVRKKGLTTAITIDAHNSIQGPFSPESVVEPLREAALDALEKAMGCVQYPIEVGTAKVNPSEFTIENGMGPGGISIIVIKVGRQKTAYVTIDGNNIVSGLRERILSRLKDLGISEGEVLTTDTHAVNGVTKVGRGYHPIGEAIDQKKLIDYIAETASEALKNLENAEFSWRSENVPRIKIIGEKQLSDLCLLTERTMERVKKLAVILFPVLAILLTVTLVFL